MDGSPILMGAGASLAAGLATAIGAVPILFVRRVSQALQDTLLGFAAGVMLAASFFSLIVPGLNYAQSDLDSRTLASGVIAVAVLLGAAGLAWVNRVVPHEHFLLGRGGPLISRPYDARGCLCLRSRCTIFRKGSLSELDLAAVIWRVLRHWQSA